MSQLKYRLRNLERVINPPCERVYVLSVGLWGGVYYLLVPEGKVREEEKHRFHGPFNAFLAAAQWALDDLKARHPGAYSRLEKEGLDSVIDGMLKQRQLMVHLELETSPTSPAVPLERETEDHVAQP